VNSLPQRTLILLLSLGPLVAETGSSRLRDASLEELMNVEISSFARKQQKLSQTAGAVFVITADDIRRSGATVLPEVFRLVPGMHVGRIDSSKWAISARGFASRLSNKMLVLIDGRSIYNNIYGGVFWDQHDLPLEEIERIEVIRGPGATSWGANAVNGVINVITKRAADTQGARAAFVTGGEERSFLSARWGGALGKNLHYRVTGKAFRVDGLRPSPGGTANNDWNSGRLGFRMDWKLSDRDELTVLADQHEQSGQQTISRQFSVGVTDNWLVAPLTASGGFGLVRWRRQGERLDTTLHAYYTTEWRAETGAETSINQTDLDLQQRYRWRARHDLVWGLGYRVSRDRMTPGRASFTPARQTDTLSSSFVQDEITLVPDKLVFTIGTKLIHNSYTGLEFQPGVRILWTPGPKTSLWASLTRAVRTPTRYEQGLRVELAIPDLPVQAFVLGSPQLNSENVLAYEGGFRRQFGRKLSLDVAGYLNSYGGLIAAPLNDLSFSGGRVLARARFANALAAVTRGVETSLQWEVTSRWRVSAGHNFFLFRENLPAQLTSTVIVGERGDRNPRSVFQGQTSFELGRRMQADVFVYQVSQLPYHKIPAYTRVDARWSWKMRPELEMSAGVRNAFQPGRIEGLSEDVAQTANRRTAYLRLEWVWGGR
jgi:iron complex outermembrane recepter protein